MVAGNAALPLDVQHPIRRHFTPLKDCRRSNAEPSRKFACATNPFNRLFKCCEMFGHVYL
jgi:hypothetical protein